MLTLRHRPRRADGGGHVTGRVGGLVDVRPPTPRPGDLVPFPEPMAAGHEDIATLLAGPPTTTRTLPVVAEPAPRLVTATDELLGLGADDDLASCGGLLEPCGHVDCIAGDEARLQGPSTT